MISETDVSSVDCRLQDAEESLEKLHECTCRISTGDSEAQDLFDARLRQLQELSEKASDAFHSLMAAIAPWPTRRESFPSHTVVRIDHVIARMNDLLTAIRNHLNGTTRLLQSRKDSLQEILDRLSQQRSAHKGYQPSSGPAQYLKKQA